DAALIYRLPGVSRWRGSRLREPARSRGRGDDAPSRAVSRGRKLKLLAHRACDGTLAGLLAVVGHHLFQGVPEIGAGFVHGFSFGKDFRQFLEVAGETALRLRLEDRRQFEFVLLRIHWRSLA